MKQWHIVVLRAVLPRVVAGATVALLGILVDVGLLGGEVADAVAAALRAAGL